MDTKDIKYLIDLVVSNKLDMLEVGDIKIIKSKHDSTITTDSPQFKHLSQEEKDAQIDKELFE